MNCVHIAIVKVAAALVGMAAVTQSAFAAVVSLESVTRLTANPSPIDLTTDGPLDWAYWAPTGSGLTPPVAPTNEKASASLISSMSVVGGTTLRGSGSSTTLGRYTWTDGTSPATGTNASLAGLIFNGDLGTSAAGKGLSITLTGDPSVTRYANLYFGGFAATATLTLTLNGATTVIDASQVFANTNPKQLAVYAISYRPDSAADLLTVQYTASAITDTTNGHVGAQAVTVSNVPEPAVLSAASFGLLLLMRRRRPT